jgi:hypothetical protein
LLGRYAGDRLSDHVEDAALARLFALAGRGDI